MIDVTIPLSQIPLWPFQVALIGVCVGMSVISAFATYVLYKAGRGIHPLGVINIIAGIVLVICLANWWWPFLVVNFT